MRRQFPQEQFSWLEDVFEGLNEADLQHLQTSGKMTVLEEGDLVSDFRDSVVRIESGLVKMAVSSEDRSLAVGLFGPNDTVCAPLFHPWDSDLFFLQAQEQSEVRVIPQKAILDL